MNLTFTRRTFAAQFASLLSALGVTATLLPSRASGQSSAAQNDGGIRKLNLPEKWRRGSMPFSWHTSRKTFRDFLNSARSSRGFLP